MYIVYYWRIKHKYNSTIILYYEPWSNRPPDCPGRKTESYLKYKIDGTILILPFLPRDTNRLQVIAILFFLSIIFLF